MEDSQWSGFKNNIIIAWAIVMLVQTFQDQKHVEILHVNTMIVMKVPPSITAKFNKIGDSNCIICSSYHTKSKRTKDPLRIWNKIPSEHFSTSMANIGIIGKQNKTDGQIQKRKKILIKHRNLVKHRRQERNLILLRCCSWCQFSDVPTHGTSHIELGLKSISS